MSLPSVKLYQYIYIYICFHTRKYIIYIYISLLSVEVNIYIYICICFYTRQYIYIYEAYIIRLEIQGGPKLLANCQMVHIFDSPCI